MTHWQGYPVPALRHEALYGDRMVRCFGERPKSFHAMVAASVARQPEVEALVCEGRRFDLCAMRCGRRAPGAGRRAPGAGRLEYLQTARIKAKIES